MRGCTGKVTGPDPVGERADHADQPGQADRVVDVGRPVGGDQDAGALGGRRRRTPRATRVSITGLPTTNTRSAGTPSAPRKAAARSVGAKCSEATAAATRRLTSSTLRAFRLRRPGLDVRERHAGAAGGQRVRGHGARVAEREDDVGREPAHRGGGVGVQRAGARGGVGRQLEADGRAQPEVALQPRAELGIGVLTGVDDVDPVPGRPQRG